MKMLLAGGGTGGHLFPAVAIAEQLLQQDKEAEVRFVGTARGLEASLLPKLGMTLDLIDMVGLVGKGLGGMVQLLPKLLLSLKQSRRILKDFKPDIVVGVGGYVSFPVLVAAKLKGIPFILHEQNAAPGLSNLILARLAKRICLSIPGSGKRFPQHKLIVTGNPLRKGLATVETELPRPGKILVFGGSRGASAINQLVKECVPQLRQLGVDAEIIHQTGHEDYAAVVRAYQGSGETKVAVYSFIDDMATAYRDARLVICRAGATTIAELCACGRPAIMIPYPFAAADHQTTNALAMVAAGAAEIAVQSELTAALLSCQITKIWQDSELLQQMAAAAGTLAKKDAAAKVLAVCRQVIDEG